jgi:Rrf2 family protein
MKLSAQEEYGLRCLLYMARRDFGEIHTIPEISQAEGLSSHHVAKLMRILRRGELVISARGQSGGYRLAAPPTEMKVRDAMRALGGPMFSPAFCGRHAGLRHECLHADDCSLRSLWSTLQTMVDTVLGNTSLSALLCPEEEMTAALRPHLQAQANGKPTAVPQEEESPLAV